MVTTGVWQATIAQKTLVDIYHTPLGWSGLSGIGGFCTVTAGEGGVLLPLIRGNVAYTAGCMSGEVDASFTQLDNG